MSNYRVDPRRSSQPASDNVRVGMDGVVRRGPDGLSRPRTAAAPKLAPAPRPQPAPVRQPQHRPQPAPAPVQRHQAPAPQRRPQPQPEYAEPALRPAKRKRSYRGIKVFFQTLLALFVILGVAVAIVVLYLRYYQ